MYALITAEAPSATRGQIGALSRALAKAYDGGASARGAGLTARLRGSQEPPVLTVSQAAYAAQKYLNISAGLVGITNLRITDVSSR